MFGYEDKQGYVNPNALKDGEIVDVMILGWRFKSSYLEALKKENDIKKTEAEDLGDEFVPKQASVKEGGMTFDYAVIKRNRGNGVPKEYVFGSDETNLVEPYFQCFGQFDVDTPKQIQDKGFDTQRRVGGNGLTKDGNVYMINEFPKASSQRNINGKWTPFEEIPEFIDKYPEYKLDEETRQADWEKVNEAYKGLSEQEVLEGLLLNTSRRFLMCHIVDKKPCYILPKKGVTFRCRIDVNSKGFPFISVLKSITVEGEWNTTYYSAYNTYEPTQDDIDYADALIKLKNDNKEKRIEAKKNKAEQKEEKMVEQEEFEPFWDDDGKPAF